MMIVDPYRFEATGPATIAYSAAYVPTNAGATATQTGVSFGSVASKRAIIIAVHWNATVAVSGISSATIGGNSAVVSVLGSPLGSSSPWKNVALIAAYVPTGTSGTVVVNFSGGGSVAAYFFVWQATNIRSLTPFGTGSAISASSPIGTTCNLQADGVLLAAATNFPLSTPMSFSGVTKDYEIGVAGVGQLAGGSSLTPSAVTGATIQYSDPGGTAGGPIRTLIVASFR